MPVSFTTTGNFELFDIKHISKKVPNMYAEQVAMVSYNNNY